MNEEFKPVGLLALTKLVVSRFRDDTKLPGGMIQSKPEEVRIGDTSSHKTNRMKDAKLGKKRNN